jgi:hypothetical protein
LVQMKVEDYGYMIRVSNQKLPTGYGIDEQSILVWFRAALVFWISSNSTQNFYETTS